MSSEHLNYTGPLENDPNSSDDKPRNKRVNIPPMFGRPQHNGSLAGPRESRLWQAEKPVLPSAALFDIAGHEAVKAPETKPDPPKVIEIPRVVLAPGGIPEAYSYQPPRSLETPRVETSTETEDDEDEEEPSPASPLSPPSAAAPHPTPAAEHVEPHRNLNEQFEAMMAENMGEDFVQQISGERLGPELPPSASAEQGEVHWNIPEQATETAFLAPHRPAETAPQPAPMPVAEQFILQPHPTEIAPEQPVVSVGNTPPPPPLPPDNFDRWGRGEPEPSEPSRPEWSAGEMPGVLNPGVPISIMNPNVRDVLPSPNRVERHSNLATGVLIGWIAGRIASRRNGRQLKRIREQQRHDSKDNAVNFAHIMAEQQALHKKVNASEERLQQMQRTQVPAHHFEQPAAGQVFAPKFEQSPGQPAAPVEAARAATEAAPVMPMQEAYDLKPGQRIEQSTDWLWNVVGKNGQVERTPEGQGLKQEQAPEQAGNRFRLTADDTDAARISEQEKVRQVVGGSASAVQSGGVSTTSQPMYTLPTGLVDFDHELPAGHPQGLLQADYDDEESSFKAVLRNPLVWVGLAVLLIAFFAAAFL